jgi:Uma2 family endonuclease
MTIREEIIESIVPDYEAELEKPMAGKNHARIQSRLIIELAQFEHLYDALPELDLELPGRARPDICIYPNLSYDWWAEEHKVKEAPITTIEILSYQQGVEDLIDKAKNIYFPAGVKSAWFVEPAFGIIHVVMADRETLTFTRKEMLDDPMTRVRIELGKVFR